MAKKSNSSLGYFSKLKVKNTFAAFVAYTLSKHRNTTHTAGSIV